MKNNRDSDPTDPLEMQHPPYTNSQRRPLNSTSLHLADLTHFDRN
jgi:hypothetical protein